MNSNKIGTMSALLPPILDIHAYAELTKQEEHVVRNQINSNILPFIQPAGHKGKVFINMVALAELCANAEKHKAVHNRVEWHLI